MNVLITGISGNLGTATATHLKQQGHLIVGCVDADQRVQIEGIKTISANLTDEGSSTMMIAEAIKLLGNIDYGILLVGGFAMGDIEHTDWDAMEGMLNLNFKTAWNVARPLYAHMIAKGAGRIILTGARPGLKAETATGAVGYALSKSLIFRLSEMINTSGKGKGVDSAVIVPSTIDTPQNRLSMPKADFTKWVSAQAIAEVIGWLCSPGSRPLRETVIKLYGDS